MMIVHKIKYAGNVLGMFLFLRVMANPYFVNILDSLFYCLMPPVGYHNGSIQ